MTHRDAPTRGQGESRPAQLLLHAALAFALALVLQAAMGAGSVEGLPTPATATATATPTKTATATATATSTPTATAPAATATKAPSATPSPSPAPGQDLAVALFNNFCERGQPLMATIFNTSATPLNGRSVRLRLSTDTGVLEEHDHYLNLKAYSSVNLPLANTARPPWVKIEIMLLGTPSDPNPNNDSSSCGVPGDAAESQVDAARSGGSSSSGGGGAEAVLRKPAPSQTPTPAGRQPARAGATSNSPQPSLTPIGDAGGGLAPPPAAGFASRTLMVIGVVLLAGGSSWAFYYLTKPPKNA